MADYQKLDRKSSRKRKLRLDQDALNRGNRTIKQPKICIVQVFSPVVIKVDASDFSSAVQRLTGKTVDQDQSTDVLHDYSANRPYYGTNPPYSHYESDPQVLSIDSSLIGGEHYACPSVRTQERSSLQAFPAAELANAFLDEDGFFCSGSSSACDSEKPVSLELDEGHLSSWLTHLNDVPTEGTDSSWGNSCHMDNSPLPDPKQDNCWAWLETLEFVA